MVSPLPAALLAFVTPHRMVVVTAVGLLAVALGGILVVPAWGAMGAAVLVMAVKVCLNAWVAALARVTVRQRHGHLEHASPGSGARDGSSRAWQRWRPERR